MGAVMASTMATTLPADAAVPKIAIFGLGNPTAMSDAYNQNDADAISPYSQFPNPKGAIYEDGADNYKTINKRNVERSFQRLEPIPTLLKRKNVQGVMQQLQSDDMKRSIEYMSKPEGSAAWETKDQILTALNDLGAFNNQRKWGMAQETYTELQGLISKWKSQV